MSRFTLVLAAALSFAASVAHADPINEATRHGHIVTPHGVWDSR